MIKTATLLALMASTVFATVDNYPPINKGIEAKNDHRNFQVTISNEMSQNKYASQSGLKTKTTHMPKVYLEYIGHDISGPTPPTGGGGQTVNVTTENTQIKNLCNYFFGEDITTESGYAVTTTYLTTKINSLYS